MKPAPFSYVRPTRLQDVAAELSAAETGGGGKVIAGGQSLMPVLAMRLGRPSTLIDITRVDGLGQLRRGNAHFQIGAAVRQRTVEREVTPHVPLVGYALPWIGHREIRSRGTVCGSIAHADPSAELPAVALCLGATLNVYGPDGARQIPAAEFFTGAMSNALRSTEILTSAEFPLLQPGEGFGFAEISRRHGDFALAGVATRVRLTAGEVVEAQLVSFGVSDRPKIKDLTEPLAEAVNRHSDDEPAVSASIQDAVGAAAEQMVTTGGDTNASADYRRRLVRVLGGRALVRACADSKRRTKR